jgi:formylglycine-generating enzyme required for sulfatase activity/CheY-like chemotaxis protein
MRSHKKILVVDAQKELFGELSWEFSGNMDWEVVLERSSNKALQRLQKETFDVVAINFVLPDGLGIDLVRQLRLKFPHVLYVMIAEQATQEMHDEAYRLTSNNLLIKPIKPEALASLREFDPGTAHVPGQTASAAEGFTGQLDQFQLIDIVQMCCISRKTGKLMITRGAQSGIIYVKEGNIVHAEVGAKQGDEAVYEIVGWDYGRFALDLHKTAPIQTIYSGWEHLLMEGTRRRDEQRGKEEVNLRKEAQTSPLDLIGKTIGPYTISRELAQDDVGTLYEAIQANVNRPVAVKVLNPKHYEEETTVDEFIAFATAMAKAQSPYITAVYEVGESNGLIYYTREHFPGIRLSDEIQQAHKWSEDLILRTTQNIANAFAYLHKNNILHHPPLPEFILVSEDGTPKLLNNVTTEGIEMGETEEQEIKRVSQDLVKVAPSLATVSDDVRGLLNAMLGKERPVLKTWASVAQKCQTIEMARRSARAAASSQMLTPVAVPVVEERRKFRLSWMHILEIIVAIAAILLMAGYFLGWYKGSAVHDIGAMIKIPTTAYKFQNDRQITVNEFYIDKYEVTIDQYARFIQEYEKNPEIVKAPGMPEDAKIKPEDWENILKASRNRMRYQGQELRGDSPIFNVTWWGAYAYANWAGKRLPREEEWELAMGAGKNKYPWGNELMLKKINLGEDYDPDPNKMGKIDGYTKWAPVGASRGDQSAYGVMDMAGNVSEWTQTPSTHLHLPSEQVYVIRGSSFQAPKEELVDGILMRTRTVAPIRQLPSVGFRCASDKPVSPK